MSVNFGEMASEGAHVNTAASAIDACSQKTVEIGPQDATTAQDRRMLTIVCPKYPTGTEYVEESRIPYIGPRGKAAMRLGCTACTLSQEDPDKTVRKAQADALHERIREIPGKLYIEGHFTESVFRGLVTVKEVLREVSGHESAAEAVGKGGLYFLTDRGSHVEKAYQQAAQFTLMAVDNLRNVEAHSLPSETEVTRGAGYAFPRLMTCSLALGFLDTIELRK